MPVCANLSDPAPQVNRICAQRPDGVFRFKGVGEQPIPPKLFLVGQLFSLPQTKATQNLISHPEFFVVLFVSALAFALLLHVVKFSIVLT
jgi:hypothetical protein